MRVVVTGGAGFIGSHVVERLVARGDTVAVIDDLRRACVDWHEVDAVRLLRAPIESARAARWVRAFRPEAVVHLAAQIDVGASIRNPQADAKTNIMGTLNLLQAAADAGASRYIMASSGGAIYGDASIRPTPETAPLQPLSPYGISKCVGEMYLAHFTESTSLRCLALRFANVYGPRQGQGGEAGVVSIFWRQLRRGMPVTVYGNGKQTRDYVYVGCVADAVVCGLDAAHVTGEFNIGTQREVSLLRLIEMMASQCDYRPQIRFEPARSAEVAHSALECSRAKQVLAWSPKVTVERGLAMLAAAEDRAAGRRSVAMNGGRSLPGAGVYPSPA